MGLLEVVQLYRERKQQEELKALQEQALKDQELFASTKDIMEESLKKELGELYDVLVEENHGHFIVRVNTEINFQFTYLKHKVVIIFDGERNGNRFLIQGCGTVQTMYLHDDLLKFLANLGDVIKEFEVHATVTKKVKAINKDTALTFLKEELQQHGFEAEVDY